MSWKEMIYPYSPHVLAREKEIGLTIMLRGGSVNTAFLSEKSLTERILNSGDFTMTAQLEYGETQEAFAQDVERQLDFQSEVPGILEGAAKTFAQRGKVYGCAYKKHGEVLAKLFPAGLHLETPDDHNRFAAFNAIVGKLTRYSNQMESGGHKDSAHDIINFAAMLEELTDEAG